MEWRDGDEVARECETAVTHDQVCYRCNRLIDKSHDRNFYCPAFGSMHEGTWLPFDRIMDALRAHRPFTYWYSCAMEDPADRNEVYHRVVGVGLDGRYIGRLESPTMPEYSVIWRNDEPFRALAGLEGASSREPYAIDHEFVYKGWRGQLRSFCRGLDIPFDVVCADLGVNCDPPDEYTTRYQLGWS